MENKKYFERCLRSIGIMDEAQLHKIKNTKVAVAGLGLGGSVFINLVRLGFTRFNVADPDIFERSNINRQRGAKETTVGTRKDDCLIQEARAINPEIDLLAFREGVTSTNSDKFLADVDWVVDAVDVFAIPEKIALHEAAARRKIPVATCVSVGFGASIVVFSPTSPSFSELAGVSATAPYETNIDRFVRFVTPEIPPYMQEQLAKAMDRSSHIPFVVPGVEISAALVATEICKFLLGIGKPITAPHGIYFDPIENKTQTFRADYRERTLVQKPRLAS